MQTKIVKIDPNNPDSKIIKEAAEILQKGGIVAFPTETVYGLAVDYNNPKAIEKLYEIKKRQKGKPFTIHIANKSDITKYIDEPDKLTKNLIDKFWPGPLTIIVKTKAGKSFGFRMPDNKVALELIRTSNLALVAPSANISGTPAPKEAFSVVKVFDGIIDMVLDAGCTDIGESSTIVDTTGRRPRIIREGDKLDGLRTVLHEHVRHVITNILIVCAGNSCRSPMGYGLLSNALKTEGFNIKSAGIIAMDGFSPSAETIAVMKRYADIDLTDFLTSKLTQELVNWADIVLVMDKSQVVFIENMFPEAKNKTHLFREYAGIVDGKPDVLDPMGKPFLAYEESYKQIKEAAEEIIKKLKEE